MSADSTTANWVDDGEAAAQNVRVVVQKMESKKGDENNTSNKFKPGRHERAKMESTPTTR